MVSTGRLNEVGLKAVFNKFDVDNSGAVDANEMASMIKMLKLERKDIDDIKNSLPEELAKAQYFISDNA